MPDEDQRVTPGTRIMGLYLEVFGSSMMAAIAFNSMIQGMQLSIKSPEWARAFVHWAENHVTDSGMAYPALDDDLARAIMELGRIEVSDDA